MYILIILKCISSACYMLLYTICQTFFFEMILNMKRINVLFVFLAY